MTNEEVKREIESVLDSMVKAFATKDVELYMSLYDSNPDLVIYGSQSGEKWTILKDFKEAVVHNWQMVKGVDVKYTYQRIEVHASGDVAWFATELSFNLEMNGQQVSIPGRLTGVLGKKDDKWKFKQTHYSMEHH
ncbi:MAG: nuclear transport factor 2 family protein [Promethearchaeota archaeon]